MKEIFKTLKKSTLPIIFIIVLLFFEAMCDLKLPDYTSKIVNIGIQQNGIESTLPDTISQSLMDKLTMFLTEEDRQLVLDNYSVLNKDELSEEDKINHEKNYPILATENVYTLNKVDNSIKIQLTEMLKKPLLTVYVLSNEEMVNKMTTEEMRLPEEMSIFDVLTMMSSVQINEIMTKIDESIDVSFQDSMIIQSIYDEYQYIGLDIKGMQLNYLIISGIKMLAFVLLGVIITIVVAFLSSIVASSFSRDVRSKVMNKIMYFSTKEYKEISPASLITRSTNDIQQIQLFLTLLFRIVIYAPILGIGAFLKISSSSMSWVIGLAVGSIILLIVVLFSIALPKIQIVQRLIDRLNLVSREIISGVLTIRAFSNEKQEEKKFDKANTDLMKVNLFVNKIMVVMMPFMMFIMNGVSVLIIWVGAGKVDNSLMQVGDLMAFIQYTMQIIISFLMISMMSIMMPRALVSFKRISEVLNKNSSVKDPVTESKFLSSKKGEVEFVDVYFRYPDAEEDVLHDVSFKAIAGTTTAIIGSTGCGKSTLINLIPRFFDVTGGKILVDGVNVKDIKQTTLRKKIGYVPQKGSLFSGTIKSNLKIGNNRLTEQELEEIVEVAQASDFINDKKNKFDTEISQGGTNVSGGQRQRLAIARAIAVKPDIYIFDDSFSALDFTTEKSLRKALKKKVGNATVFIVAQRISTVLHADQIIVLDEGEVVGIGKHSDLLKNCKVYQEIALSQLSKEELANE
ncbi:MAG: ABC transporter ATP-binding protein [bacterium]|nr:ABC transporter ATP-binding protein [bacterium]